MKKNERTEQDYRDAASKSFSIAGMCRVLGLGAFGANYRRIHKAIKEYNIDISHFTGKGWNIGCIFDPSRGIKKDLSEILVENSTYDNTVSLKSRLLNEGLKEYKCERCGRTEWEGELIPLQLHHINGNRSDNRIENLQLLCPNCHALTDNYCGKNSNHIRNLTLEEKDIKIREVYGDYAKVIKKRILEKSTKPKEKKYCPICGTEITKDKRSTYCSYECAYRAQKKLPENSVMNEHIRNGMSISQIANLYNVTEASVRKWIRQHKT